MVDCMPKLGWRIVGVEAESPVAMGGLEEDGIGWLGWRLM